MANEIKEELDIETLQQLAELDGVKNMEFDIQVTFEVREDFTGVEIQKDYIEGGYIGSNRTRNVSKEEIENMLSESPYDYVPSVDSRDFYVKDKLRQFPKINCRFEENNE